MKAAAMPAIALLVLLQLAHAAGAGEVESCLQEGDELYCTYHLGQDRLDRAIRLYENAHRARPDDYRILWRISEMYQIYGTILGEDQEDRKIELWERGVEYGKKAIEADPEGKEGHFYYMANLGAMVRQQGALSSVTKARRLRKEIERVLQIDPDYAPGLVAKAQYLTKMPRIFGGDDEEAMRLYERAVRSDPGYLVAYHYMAQLDAEHGRYDEAEAKLRRVLENDRSGCEAAWSMIDRPWAEKLLREIRAKKADR
ncbi:MAG: tetratricopeptide repeat protein [bacterium]